MGREKRLGKKRPRKYAELNHKKDFISLSHGYAKPLYVSGKKPDEEKTLKELGATKIVIGVLVCVLLGIAGYWAFVTVVFPYFRVTDIDMEKVSQAVEQVKDFMPKDSFFPETYDTETGLPVYEDDFNLFLINSSHPVDDTFQVPLEEYGGVQVDKRIIPALRMLVNKAEEEGITLTFSSGYVSYQEQEPLYLAKVQELETQEGRTTIMARAEAKKFVAYPGEADAQTGMSVTVEGDQENFATSDVYYWLNRNAAEYGFVFRFPSGKDQYTGKEEDTRVLRYVGKENALKMRQLSMCLEEYVDYLSTQ